ncbi:MULTISPECIES: hypothetical protein [Halomonadaceae]|uniref:hypothetical protein n=1 Tax=Halomonadaceae TaxID=28256 RepID=UPI001587A54B|nr:MULTISPECIES: hypothetical protein [Halomonas]MCD6009354.1 hypothetical protein [Halomonas sp. IOP_31]
MLRSRQGKRIEILLLITMLANVVVMVVGLDVRAPCPFDAAIAQHMTILAE